jgi:hypothetical protein
MLIALPPAVFRFPGFEKQFRRCVTGALAFERQSGLIGAVLKKANLLKGRDAKPPV